MIEQTSTSVTTSNHKRTKPILDNRRTIDAAIVDAWRATEQRLTDALIHKEPCNVTVV